MPNPNWFNDQKVFRDEPDILNAESLWLDPKLQKLYEAKDLENTRLLKMVRQGIPHMLRGRVYAKILKVDKMDAYDKNFELALKRTYGAVVPEVPLPPTFGGRTHKMDLALSKEGEVVADHILCILAHDFPSLEYCPYVTTLTYLLCHVMDTPDEALGAIVSIVKQALQRSGSGGGLTPLDSPLSSSQSTTRDWRFFPTFRKDSRYLLRAFGNLLAKQNAKLHHHIAELQTMHPEPIWSRWMTDLYVGTLPQPMLWRILDSFVVEGYKTLFRIGIALLQLHKDALMKTATVDVAMAILEGGFNGDNAGTAAGIPIAGSPPATKTSRTSATSTPSVGGATQAAWSNTFKPFFAAAWWVNISTADIRGALTHHSTLSAISQGDDLNETPQLKYQRGTPKLKDPPSTSPVDSSGGGPAGAKGKQQNNTSANDGDQGSIASDVQTTAAATGAVSAIMSDDYWIALWSWIPPNLRMTELELMFSTRHHGHHISTLFAQTSDRKPMIILIETATGVFGAFLSEAWPETDDKRGNFYGTGETFLFTLKPRAKMYAWVGRDEDLSTAASYADGGAENDQDAVAKSGATFIRDRASCFIMATKRDITIGGGGNGHGLWLNEDLSHGTTDNCLTFDNDPLTGNSKEKFFNCLNVEVFAFV